MRRERRLGTMRRMSPNEPRRNAPQFSSLDAATDFMDVTDEPMVATTQLLFREEPSPAAAPPPAAAPLPRPAQVGGRTVAPLPQDPVAMLEELLLRLRGNLRNG